MDVEFVAKVEVNGVTTLPLTPLKPETWIEYTVDGERLADGVKVIVTWSLARDTTPAICAPAGEVGVSVTDELLTEV